MKNSVSIAFIGFGEVGRTFSRDLRQRPGVTLAAYDILLANEARRHEITDAAEALGVTVMRSPAQAVAGADIIFSAVTASEVMTVAREAARHIRPGQYLIDVNSASPNTKSAAADLVRASGGRYVEAAVMAPVKAPGLQVPILAGGPDAADAAALLNALGMKITPVAAEFGRASAMKLCRSIMIKGIEALIVDASRAASAFKVEAEFHASLAETFPSIDWRALAETMGERVATHGLRRAAEMREAADMVAEIGLEPALALAVADAQQRGARPK